MARWLLALTVALVGCATPAPPEPRVVVKEVRIPVPVTRTAPPALTSCGNEAPGFRFYATTDPTYRTGLDKDGEQKLREWVDAKDRCIRAWHEWSRP